MSARSITPAVLQAVGASPQNAQTYAGLLEDARYVQGDSWNTITSLRGTAMLVAQLAHESGHFSTIEENLNYSAIALRQGNRAKYFTQDQAQLYGSVRDQAGHYIQRANIQMVANLYYGTRMGNRGVESGDGWTFRGSGLIQLTGRKNHTAFAATVGMSPEEGAEYCRTPEGAVKSALWYWRLNGLIRPASVGDVTQCTYLINGGDAGLSSRLSLYKTAIAALS